MVLSQVSEAYGDRPTRHCHVAMASSRSAATGGDIPIILVKFAGKKGIGSSSDYHYALRLSSYLLANQRSRAVNTEPAEGQNCPAEKSRAGRCGFDAPPFRSK